MTDAVLEKNELAIIQYNESSILPPAYVQRQSISVNSPNHLNGSVITVQESSIVTPFVSTLSDSPNSSVSSQISSTNFDKVILKPPCNLETEEYPEFWSSLIKQNCDIILRPGSFSENYSELSTCKSETSVTESCHGPITAFKINPEVFSVDSSVGKDANSFTVLNIENCVSTFDVTDEKSVLLKTGRLGPINLNYQSVFPDISSGTSVVDIKLSNFSQENVLNLQNFSYSPSKVHEFYTNNVSSLSSPLNLTDNGFSETSTRRSGKILISTGLQSGAYISIKPASQPKELPIYVSDCDATLSPSDEPIKVKKEPQEIPDESEKFELLPIIVDVSSVNENVINEKAATPNTKVEISSSIKDDSSMDSHNSTSNPSNDIIQEDDYYFLMSLLPKLRQMPNKLKRKLKSDVQNLVTSSVIRANEKKRKASEIG